MPARKEFSGVGGISSSPEGHREDRGALQDDEGIAEPCASILLMFLILKGITHDFITVLILLQYNDFYSCNSLKNHICPWSISVRFFHQDLHFFMITNIINL